MINIEKIVSFKIPRSEDPAFPAITYTGGLLIFGDKDGMLYAYTNIGELIKSVNLGTTITSIAFYYPLILIGDDYGQVIACDILYWRWRSFGHLSMHGISSMCYLSDGWKVIHGDMNGELELWDLETTNKLVKFKGNNNGAVRSIAISSKDDLLISGGYDGNVILWDIKTGHQIFSCESLDGIVMSVGFSSNCEKFIYSTSEGIVHVYNIIDYKEICTINNFGYHSNFLPNSDFFLFGNGIWDCSSSKKIYKLNGLVGYSMYLDYKYTGTSTNDGQICSATASENYESGEYVIDIWFYP